MTLSLLRLLLSIVPRLSSASQVTSVRLSGPRRARPCGRQCHLPIAVESGSAADDLPKMDNNATSFYITNLYNNVLIRSLLCQYALRGRETGFLGR